ncbi:MAG: hypothetical protein K2Z81_04640, partial [Cyanobacteria bacterium]|nr:hypothetical protein [Cyanobacteriota bacterium]
PSSSLHKDDWENFADSLREDPQADQMSENAIERSDPGLLYPLDSGVVDNTNFFDCNGNDFGSWNRFDLGIVHGGSDLQTELDEDFLDHL